MRNIIINKEQEKLLAEAIQQDYVLSRISNKIKHDIESDNTPISNLKIPHSVNKKTLNDLLISGYMVAKNNFSDDIESFPIERIVNKLDKLTAICQKKEEKIRTELEKLCVDIVMSYFNMDEFEDITLECRLVTDLSNDDFHIEPNSETPFELDNADSYNDIDLKITNRKLSNTLVMGGALSLYDKLQSTFIQELFKLDEDLPHLYSKILKINEYLMFIDETPITDTDTHQTGCVKVMIGGETGNEITALGTIFPFLLIETFRGCLELLSDKMLPFNVLDSDEITDKSDILIDEPWYMILGKQLWNRVTRDEDDDITIVNELFHLNAKDFNSILTNVILNTSKAQSLVDHLHRTAQYNKDYSNFEKDLEKRRMEQELLVDD